MAIAQASKKRKHKKRKKKKKHPAVIPPAGSTPSSPTWTLYCSLLNHRDLGMQATLTVN
jgi:hypothetical protein